MSRSYEVFSDALGRLRTAHAAEGYEYATSQTYCPASDGPTDQCDICTVLRVLPRTFRGYVRAAEASTWDRATPEAQKALARETAALEAIEDSL